MIPKLLRQAFVIAIVSGMTWIAAPGAGAQTAPAAYPMFDLRTYSATIPGVLIYGYGVSYDVTLVLRDAQNGYFVLTGLAPSRATQLTAVYVPNTEVLYIPVVGITDGVNVAGIRDVTLYALASNPYIVFGLRPPASSSSNNGCGNMNFDDCMFNNYGIITPSVPW